MEANDVVDMSLGDWDLNFPIELPKLKRRLATEFKLSKTEPIVAKIHCTGGELEDLTTLRGKGNITLCKWRELLSPDIGLEIVGTTTLTKFQVNYPTCNWTVNGVTKPKFKLEMTGPKDNSFFHEIRFTNKTACDANVIRAFFAELPSMKARTPDPLLTDVLNHLIEKDMTHFADQLGSKVSIALGNMMKGEVNICKFISKSLGARKRTRT